jgi:5-methylcytosine-specific restriction endonuclease McrA
MTRTGPDRETALKVIQRFKGQCLRCWSAGSEIQHRLARKAGGRGKKGPPVNALPYLVFVCRRCHDVIENRERAKAYDDGWALKENSDPTAVPLVDIYGHRYLLTWDGDVVDLGCAA